jgi:predicted nucleic acid-binding protein
MIHLDCLIAATAMVNQSQLATLNHADFKAFTSYGLILA